MNNKSKILIVDDIHANHHAVAEIISELDVELFFADSGNEALRLIIRHEFALILMDVNMPEIDGIETTRLIKGSSSSRYTPIIIISAHCSTPEMLLSAYDAGVVDFISKPLIPEILLQKVSQFVDLWVAQQVAESAINEKAEAESQLSVLMKSSDEGIIGLDLDGRIISANSKASEILQAEHSLLRQQSLENYFCSTHNRQIYWRDSTIYCYISSGISGHCNSEHWRRRDKSKIAIEYSCEPIVNASGKVTGGMVIFQDTTGQQMAESKHSYLNTYDALTNLSNRSYFHDNLDKAISRSKRSKVPLGILKINVDHFQYVNDTYGLDSGDKVLQELAERFGNVVRSGDVVARIGGDEFGIILYDVRSKADAVNVAQKLLSVTTGDITLEGKVIKITSSIGVALYDCYTLGMADLIKQVDVALNEAKEQGRNNCQVFIQNMRHEMIEKRRIQMMLQRAVSSNELFLLYQPKISLKRKRIVGCEALLRWLPKDEALMNPATFIPIAEESGQIVEIGEWVLDAACQQMRGWKTLGGKGFVVSINVSTRQLRAGTFHGLVEASLKKYSIDPAMLEIEVTETGVLDDERNIIGELEKIHNLGVNISIDDFGTGNASLDYLRKLPFDILKIDRSFVSDIGVDEQDEELIRVIMAVSKTMNLSVIAEGVETVEQITFLANNHCDLMQGFYFSKPVSPKLITELLEASSQVFAEQFTALDEFKKLQTLPAEDRDVIEVDLSLGLNKIDNNNARPPR